MAAARRQALTAVQVHNENQLGEARAFREIRECQMCGFKQFATAYCPGYSHMLPEEVEQACKLEGRHLHRKCAQCGHEWREKCLADDPQPEEPKDADAQRPAPEPRLPWWRQLLKPAE